jgi:TPR repeat protein
VTAQLSAEEGSPDAQYCLAVICRSGSTCFHYRKDPTSEISLLKRAAATGHSLALDRLGALLESGSEVVNPNVVEAIRCYHESGSSFAQVCFCRSFVF